MIPILVDYAVAAPPAAYACAICGAHGGKLWREYQTFADHISLHCYPCAHKRGEKTHHCSDMCGKLAWCPKLGLNLGSGDQLGWLVPAVPTTEGDTFWGYTSTPEAGVKWWKALPLFGTAPAEAKVAALEARLAEVAADPRLRLPYLIEAHEQDEWEPAEAHHDESDAEARRSGYECSTRVRALRSARAERENGGAA